MELPEKVWVCHACGKMSHDKYGDKPISRGWDVSCAIHAQEHFSKDLILDENNRVTALRQVD